MTPSKTRWLLLSFFALASAGVAASPSERLPSDAQLKQLVGRLPGENGKKAEAALREAGLSHVLPRLVRLQRSTPKNQELYFDLAFALAYFRADYRRNVERLTSLDELWNRGDPRWQEYVSDASDMRDEIPGLVDVLYRRNHDPALLRTLFTWRLDGGAAEALSDVCFDLPRRYPLSVLQVIDGSLERRQRAIETITLSAEPDQYRKTVARFRSAARRVGPALERWTRRFIRQMDLYAAIQNQSSAHALDLRRAGLSGMDLGGLELTHFNLAHANLRRANLSDSDLSGAQLQGADLRGARDNRRTR